MDELGSQSFDAITRHDGLQNMNVEMNNIHEATGNNHGSGFATTVHTNPIQQIDEGPMDVTDLEAGNIHDRGLVTTVDPNSILENHVGSMANTDLEAGNNHDRGLAPMVNNNTMPPITKLAGGGAIATILAVIGQGKTHYSWLSKSGVAIQLLSIVVMTVAVVLDIVKKPYSGNNKLHILGYVFFFFGLIFLVCPIFNLGKY